MLLLFVSENSAMINPQWLELPISITNSHGPKDVRAIEVRLYFVVSKQSENMVYISYARADEAQMFSHILHMMLDDARKLSALMPYPGLISLRNQTVSPVTFVHLQNPWML